VLVAWGKFEKLSIGAGMKYSVHLGSYWQINGWSSTIAAYSNIEAGSLYANLAEAKPRETSPRVVFMI